MILFITSCHAVFCASDTTWLNDKWARCQKDQASYYKISKEQSGLWKQEMYFRNSRKLFMVGYFKDSACYVKSGTFKWYYNTGSIKDSGIYDNNNPRYICHFHTNGKVKTIIKYNDLNHAVYVNSWTAEGMESNIDTFYHDNKHNECNKDTAYLKGIIVKEDSAWHLRFYYMDNNQLYINSWYKQRLCTTRIRNFEHYNKEGKLLDSALYYDNGRKQAVWLLHNNCMVSAYKKNDTSGVLIGGSTWYEQGNERTINPSIVYPSQPGGFQVWKKKVIGEINSNHSIDRDQLQNYYGNIHVKLLINHEGKLTAVYIRDPSAFPQMDALILSVCKRYEHWKPGTLHGHPSDFVLNCNFFFTAGVVTGYQQSY